MILFYFLQLKWARENNTFNNIEFRQGPAEDLSFIETGSVDLVLTGTAIHWFDHEKFFKEVQRILKPDTGYNNLGHFKSLQKSWFCPYIRPQGYGSLNRNLIYQYLECPKLRKIHVMWCIYFKHLVFRRSLGYLVLSKRLTIISAGLLWYSDTYFLWYSDTCFFLLCKLFQKCCRLMVNDPTVVSLLSCCSS